MDHHYFYINEILKRLGFEHFGHHYEAATHSWIIMGIMILGAGLLAKGAKYFPTKGQNYLEITIETIENFMVDITGPEGRAFFPYVATLFLYILICNLIGLVPGFFSPTASLNTTVSLALCTFFLTHAIGIKFHGMKYIKHFTGPIWWLSPLMLVLEMIGHLSRVMSLSIRLFGNIFGKEKVLGVIFAVAGFYLVPLPLLFLGILVSFIQALVFTLLSIIYFTGAMHDAH